MGTQLQDYEQREFMIFGTSELPLIDFTQVLETSIDTVRKSVDETKTFVKWDGVMPSCVSNLNTKELCFNVMDLLDSMPKDKFEHETQKEVEFKWDTYHQEVILDDLDDDDEDWDEDDDDWEDDDWDDVPLDAAAPEPAEDAPAEAAPLAAPEAAPEAAPLAAPLAAPEAAPEAAPLAAPEAADEAAPDAADDAAPLAALDAAPLAAEDAADEAACAAA